MTYPLGKRQVEELLGLFEIGRPVEFIANNRGEPWPDLKTLQKRGLVWIRRDFRSLWNSQRGCWEQHVRTPHYSYGLTEAGREAAALEKQRREAA